MTGSVLFNEVLLSLVNRQVGIATRVGSTLQIPGLGDVALDWRQQDAEFHGLNRDSGTGSLDRSWGLRLAKAP